MSYVINDFKGEGIIGNSFEKELPKAKHTEFRIKKLIKKQSHTLCVK